MLETLLYYGYFLLTGCLGIGIALFFYYSLNNRVRTDTVTPGYIAGLACLLLMFSTMSVIGYTLFNDNRPIKAVKYNANRKNTSNPGPVIRQDSESFADKAERLLQESEEQNKASKERFTEEVPVLKEDG